MTFTTKYIHSIKVTFNIYVLSYKTTGVLTTNLKLFSNTEASYGIPNSKFFILTTRKNFKTSSCRINSYRIQPLISRISNC